MNDNKKQFKEIIDEIEVERENLMDLKETFSILNFLFNEPELIQSNLDVLYGVKNMLSTSSLVISDMHDKLDISMKIHNILEK